MKTYHKLVNVKSRCRLRNFANVLLVCFLALALCAMPLTPATLAHATAALADTQDAHTDSGGSGGNENTNENTNTQPEPDPSPQPTPQPTPDSDQGGDADSNQDSNDTAGASNNASASSSNAEEDVRAESEKKTDETKKANPYSSSYRAGNATAGESNGSINWITSDNPANTSVLQMSAAYSQTETAIITTPDIGSGILCAAALGGATGAPVLYTNEDASVSTQLTDYLKNANVKRVILISNKDKDTTSAQSEFGKIAEVENICGATPSEISISVLDYGIQKNLWKPVSITLANSADTQVANVCAGYAYRAASPVLLTDESGNLTASQKKMITTSSVRALSALAHIQVVCLNGRVSNDAINAFNLLCFENKQSANVSIITAADVYQLNEKVELGSNSGGASSDSASSAEGGLQDASITSNANVNTNTNFTREINWESSIISNPDQSSCATAGVLAAKSSAPLLATGYEDISGTAARCIDTGLSTITFSGEGEMVSSAVSVGMRARLGVYDVETYSAGVSISDMANKEVSKYVDEDGLSTRTKDEVLESMDPASASRGSENYFVFAKLSDGYSGAVTAQQINAFIDSIASTYEASYGCTSVLRNSGDAFIEAARESGVNEVYLLAHAILESACGCSALARGTLNGSMNMFGIAAYDSDPNQAAAYAQGQGWNSAKAAVKGGAAWIASHYIHAETNQDTIYQMRWNVSSGSHQYATSLTWANSMSKLMNKFYNQAGIELEHTGLNFKVIRY